MENFSENMFRLDEESRQFRWERFLELVERGKKTTVSASLREYAEVVLKNVYSRNTVSNWFDKNRKNDPRGLSYVIMALVGAALGMTPDDVFAHIWETSPPKLQP